MLRKFFLYLALVAIAVFLAACTQNPATREDQPTLEQVRADNLAATNLFGSDSSGVPLLIRNIYDQNRNGRFDPSEVALSGWGVRLTRINNDGIPLEASELQVTPEATTQRWHGLFVNVPAGRYKLEELSPRVLAGVSWNTTSSATRTIDLAGTSPQAVEFTSVCLENAQVIGFPNAIALDTWKCKPEFDLAPRITNFTVSPNEVNAGARPKFSWTVADRATLEIDEGIGALSTWTGSLELEALDSIRYTLRAKNAFGSSQAQASLRVNAKAGSGLFTSAGGTSGTVFSGTLGAQYFQVPGFRLEDGRVVVGKIPYETIALDGPVQARVRGFYLFDPASSTFSTLGQIKNPLDTEESFRYTLEDALPLGGGRAMLHKIPDVTKTGESALYERYDFATDKYTKFDGPVGPTHSDSEVHQEYLIRQFVRGDTVMLVIACAGNPRGVRVETYHINTGATDSSFCTTDPENQVPYSDFTLLENGTFLVTGGQIGPNSSTLTASATARIYDPLAQRFRKISNMNQGRYLHSVTAVSNGRFLISGGTKGSGFEVPLQYVLESEVFDPHSEQFGKVGSLLEGRLEPSNPRAFQLPNGKVLLLDTYHPNDPNAKTIFKPELFDPKTGQFTATEDFLESRSGFSAVQLKDGRVFVYGGLSSDGVPLSSAEIYTP
jgi:hypothetical protein